MVNIGSNEADFLLAHADPHAQGRFILKMPAKPVRHNDRHPRR